MWVLGVGGVGGSWSGRQCPVVCGCPMALHRVYVGSGEVVGTVMLTWVFGLFSLLQFLSEFANYLAVNHTSPESPLPAIQSPVTFPMTP